MTPRTHATRWMAYALVTAGALVMLAPFWLMFVFATHARTEIFNLPPPLWFGDALAENLHILTTRVPFWRNLGWSLYVAVASTALTSSPAAILRNRRPCGGSDGGGISTVWGRVRADEKVSLVLRLSST